MSRAAEIVAYLDAHGVASAVIGGMALAVHGIARSTVDVDLLTDDARVLERSFWSGLGSAPPAEIRRGDAADPLAGVVRWDTEDAVDLIVGRGRFASNIVGRRVFLEIGGRKLPVVQAPDLILLKLAAGGPQDLLDVRLLLHADRGEWRAAVEERIETAPMDARQVWKRIDPI